MQTRVFKQGEEGVTNELFLEIAWHAFAAAWTGNARAMTCNFPL
jgi:hypothetical protein